MPAYIHTHVKYIGYSYVCIYKYTNTLYFFYPYILDLCNAFNSPNFFPQDPLVLNAPDSLNITGTMASTSLSKKVVDRVINPFFSKGKSPPWGDTELNEWVKTYELLCLIPL